MILKDRVLILITLIYMAKQEWKFLIFHKFFYNMYPK